MQTIKEILEGNHAYDKYLFLKEKGYILFECIVGSQAYGTNLPTSDIDRKFIYIDDLDSILSGTLTHQINITDDYVGYELSRFLELLNKQAPNMHEMLWSPEDCIEYCHPLFKELLLENRHKFLSTNIRFSFGEYASSQIKKARGLNKKIVNPIEKKRKTPLDFCWVPYKQGQLNVIDWLDLKGLKPEYCGLTAIDHMKYTYHLYYDFSGHAQDIEFFYTDSEEKPDTHDFCYFVEEKHQFYWDTLMPVEDFYKKIASDERKNYKGIVKKDTSNDVALSSIEKGAESINIMYFNLEGYTKYCKDYKEYWEWVEKRNEVRYQTNMSNNAGYDSKNMMHCHRLLDTCIEALREEIINVRRPNREQLLEIRNGKYSYEQLLTDAENKLEEISALMLTTNLPNEIDSTLIKEIILSFRKRFYSLK